MILSQRKFHRWIFIRSHRLCIRRASIETLLVFRVSLSKPSSPLSRGRTTQNSFSRVTRQWIPSSCSRSVYHDKRIRRVKAIAAKRPESSLSFYRVSSPSPPRSLQPAGLRLAVAHTGVQRWPAFFGLYTLSVNAWSSPGMPARSWIVHSSSRLYYLASLCVSPPASRFSVNPRSRFSVSDSDTFLEDIAQPTFVLQFSSGHTAGFQSANRLLLACE